MKYYLKALQNFTNFSGRARRSEYWYFVLFNFLFGMAAMLLDNLLGLEIEDLSIGPIYIIYALAMLLPSLALSVRRLHDIGKTGWWLLIGIIPLIGAIWLLILFVKDSDPGDNQYGPNPKGTLQVA